MTAWTKSAFAATILCSLATPLAAQTFTVIHNFNNGGDGGTPLGTQIAVNKSTLAGTTSTGGASGFGTIYSLNVNTGVVRTVYSFAGNDGHTPGGGLVFSGGNLYGITAFGGSVGCGTVFRFNAATGILTTLYSFTCSNDGGRPLGQLAFINNTLYGTTEYNGLYGAGTVFAYNIQYNSESTIYNFGGGFNDGANPQGGVSLDAGELYGTTSQGGPWSQGSVFRINLPDGGAYTTLHFFSGSDGNPLLVDGGTPLAAPVKLGGSLWGTTSTGGANGTGTVYSVNVATGEETRVSSFGSYYGDGAAPSGPLLAVAGVLYGTTSGNGGYGGGTLVSVTPATGAITELYGLGGGNGYDSLTGLAQIGGTLYGATTQGGSDYPNYAGTLFSFAP